MSEMSDAGFAEVFAEYGGRDAFVFSNNAWYKTDSIRGYWQRVEGAHNVCAAIEVILTAFIKKEALPVLIQEWNRLAWTHGVGSPELRTTVRRIKHCEDGIKTVNSSQGRIKIATCARSMLQKVDFEATLDRDPDLFATQNGWVIGLKTGTARRARSEDRISRCGKADYDPTARCEEWERVQLDVHMGREIRSRRCKRPWDTMTGRTREKKMFIWHGGTGRNGKGLTEHIIRDILGQYRESQIAGIADRISRSVSKRQPGWRPTRHHGAVQKSAWQ